MTNIHYSNSSSPELIFTQTPSVKSSSIVIFKDSKTIDFLKNLYSYPPKIKIFIKDLDESNDLKLNNKKTSSFLTTTTAFKEKTNWLTNKTTSNSIKIKNKPTSNIEAINDSSFLKNLGQSYTNKALATDFYKNSNVKIRESLQHVPVFIVLNSKNEIVLAKKRILNSNKTEYSYKNLSTYWGSSKNHNSAEEFTNLGLFFFNRKDADIYLSSILKSQLKQIKPKGFSVHCIGLDSAYEVTRNYHPEIDFRFIPSLKEISYVLGNNNENKNLIFDNSQCQLETNSFAYSKYSKRNYFKGVPIYIVQLQNKPWFGNTAYIQVVRKIDSLYSNWIKSYNFLLGSSNKVLMTGSMHQNTSESNQIRTYIFFNANQATQFYKQHKNFIIGHKDSNSRTGKNLPIYTSNLEDFLDYWEENLVYKENNLTQVRNDTLGKTEKGFNQSLLYNKLYFVPTKTSSKISEKWSLANLNNSNQPKTYLKTLGSKMQKIKNSTGFFFEAFFS